MFEGKFSLSLGTSLLIDKKQHIKLPKAKLVPVFMTCKAELGRQHKLLTPLGLEVTISESLVVVKLNGKYPIWVRCTF